MNSKVIRFSLFILIFLVAIIILFQKNEKQIEVFKGKSIRIEKNSQEKKNKILEDVADKKKKLKDVEARISKRDSAIQKILNETSNQTN